MNAGKPYATALLRQATAENGRPEMVCYGGTERPRKRGVCTSGRGLTDAYEERQL